MPKLPLLLLALLFALPAAAHAEYGVSSRLTQRVVAVTPRRVFRGPRPQDTSEMEHLRRMGIRTIVNLQGNLGRIRIPGLPGESASDLAEEQANARRAGIEYHNIPTTILSRLSAEEEQNILRIAQIMNDPRQQPVYIHCKGGKDRTGLVIAAYRILYQGCSYEKARGEMQERGAFWTQAFTHRPAAFLRRLAQEQRSSGHRCPL